MESLGMRVLLDENPLDLKVLKVYNNGSCSSRSFSSYVQPSLLVDAAVHCSKVL